MGGRGLRSHFSEEGASALAFALGDGSVLVIQRLLHVAEKTTTDSLSSKVGTSLNMTLVPPTVPPFTVDYGWCKDDLRLTRQEGIVIRNLRGPVRGADEAE